MSPVTINSITYQYYNWEELGEDIFQLAQKIIDSGLEFDRVVALAKGGLAFARSISDLTGVKEISSMTVEFYPLIGQTSEAPIITQSLPLTIRNERILLFDDLIDSGKTLQVALEYIKHLGPKSVHTATFFTKPHSPFKPDFSVEEVDAWVIFPNEIRETIGNLTDMWQKNGDDSAKIKQQLLDIGLPADHIEFFTKN